MPTAAEALADGAPKKVLMVLYAGGDHAKTTPALLGCAENALGLREWLESLGHTVVATADKEGPGCELDTHLPDADIVITTPFHPGYISAERIAAAPKLKLALTAGVGSDHVDLPAASAAGLIVAEVTGCNVVSVAEHVVMQILCLVRNFAPAHAQVAAGGWDVAEVAAASWDLEGKVVGTIGCGRIGQRVLRRLRGFDCGALLYTDYARLPAALEAELGAEWVPTKEELVARCDVVTLNCPLHAGSKGMVDAALLAKFKRGAFLVNTARGGLCVAEDVAAASRSGQLGGYAGDVWFPQPAPADHPWRAMPRNAMTPHCSGTTLDAQARYAAGVRDALARVFEGRPLNAADVIVQDGKLAPQYDQSAAQEARSLAFAPGWEKRAAA